MLQCEYRVPGDQYPWMIFTSGSTLCQFVHAETICGYDVKMLGLFIIEHCNHTLQIQF